MTLQFTGASCVTNTSGTAIGTATYCLTAGSVWRFSNVVTGANAGNQRDALVTITTLSNATLSTIDDTVNGSGARFQPTVVATTTANTTSYARFNFQFVAPGDTTGTAIPLGGEAYVTAFDVDGGGGTGTTGPRELVEFSTPVSSTLANPTFLTTNTPAINAGGASYIVASSNDNQAGIGNANEYKATALYSAGTTSFDLVLGSKQESSPCSGASCARLTSISFDINDVIPLNDVVMTKTHVGNFYQGQTGATYSLVVSNYGAQATSGTVTVTDTLPSGLTATAASGTGWTCNLNTPSTGQVRCTRSDALVSGSSYPPITLAVNVSDLAPSSVTNTATVSGGGDYYTSNNTATDVTIINFPDYGDAPTNLSAIDASLTNIYDSASHLLDGITYLGDRVDAESANQPSVNADSDDNNGGPNDEDGVIFPLAGTTRVLSSGQSNTLTVKASRAGILNAWIDWNQDGDWNDSGEQIATNVNLAAGNNTLTVAAPNAAPHGATYARFRFSTTSGLGATGATTANGEVEDYKVNVVLPAPVACNSGILNNGFEQPVIPGSGNGTPPILQDFGGGRIVSYRETDVPWWGTISNSPISGSNFDQRNAIELWNSTQTAVPAARPFEGNQFAEINAYVAGRLYQDLAVPPGSTIRWQVAHRGRAGDDTMGVLIGSPDNETSQGIYTTPNTEWRVYSGIYVVPVGQFITRFALKAVNTSGGAETSVGNFVDDVRLSNFCTPTVQGYKSAKLTTDADNNNKISPGDTLTYTLYYANSSGAATGPAAGFQINDPLPTGLSITAPGAQTITVSGGNTSANKNPNYTGATAGILSNLLNPGALLDVGGVIRVDIPVVVGPTASGILLNQGTSSANEFSGQNVQTDNADNTNTGLPTGVTIPPTSVVQPQTPAVDPTRIIVINPAVSAANVILVKRITEINGDRTQNPNATSYKLNQVLDRPSFAADDAFPANNWPSSFLVGAYDAGPIMPSDTVEYTVYFMNSSGANADSVRICDRIVGAQQFLPDAYGAGRDIEYQLGTNPVRYLTKESLASIDRAELNTSTGTIAGCPAPSITGDNNGTIVVDITGSGSSGQETLTTLPGGTAQGNPTNSYGYFRFKTRINP
ncbi:MAG: DUF11 domain-containing protein [Thermosynechococcaceae cyanobacterium MS004]|nr:DUF11 domain-containing protein [Thermosynechococcaceae cyanobacterium MS004]